VTDQPTKAPPALPAPDRLPFEALDALARDIVIGRVFLTPDPQIVRQAFLPAMLGAVPPDACAAYEYMARASDRDVWSSRAGGTPMFISVRWLHVADGAALFDRLQHWHRTIYPEQAQEAQ
jgi:hypothetical protein